MTELTARVLSLIANYRFVPHDRLRGTLSQFLRDAVNVSDLDIWSQIVPTSSGAESLFTNVARYRNGRLERLAGAWLRNEDTLASENAGRRLARISITGLTVNDYSERPQLIVFYDDHGALSDGEANLIEVGLSKITTDHVSGSYTTDQSEALKLSTASKDLTSFYHRCILSIFKPRYHFAGVSIFYYESKTESLILGATTGIRLQSHLNLKRSDIRYFTDSQSYTSSCFRDRSALIEHAGAGPTLSSNTLGENVVEIRSRIYLPLKAKGDRAGENDVIGVLRGVNINSDSGDHPLTLLELARLEYLCDTISALTRRYIRTLSILHDQERATHGYSTDLLTIKLAASTITKCLAKMPFDSVANPIAANAVREMEFRAHDILAVQDNMAQQLVTVVRHGNAELRPLAGDKDLCAEPYTSIFLRLLSAKKGMSECYNRQELRVLSSRSPRFDDSFKEIPPLRITVGALYLAVRNIAENAIKYTPKADVPTLDITWTLGDSKVHFSFRDFGIGISEVDVPYLTREGFRGRDAQHLQLRGNGLGLAVTKSVLVEAGGDLSFNRPEDDQPGSIFVVSVPVGQGG